MQRDYNGYHYHSFKTKVCFLFINVLKSKREREREREAGTYYVLLSQSRDMIGWFIKIYLHKPLTIL